MQTSSSETLIGWKSGKTILSLYVTGWRERGYGLSELQEEEDYFWTSLKLLFTLQQ